eukprot:scaffold80350_cov19-Tisochrysis_lutea.AAC.1
MHLHFACNVVDEHACLAYQKLPLPGHTGIPEAVIDVGLGSQNIKALNIRIMVDASNRTFYGSQLLRNAKLTGNSAAMYGSQMWGTGFVEQEAKLKSELQVKHLRFLKRTLGVKHSRCEAPLPNGQCCGSVVMSPCSCSFNGSDL